VVKYPAVRSAVATRLDKICHSVANEIVPRVGTDPSAWDPPADLSDLFNILSTVSRSVGSTAGLRISAAVPLRKQRDRRGIQVACR